MTIYGGDCSPNHSGPPLGRGRLTSPCRLRRLSSGGADPAVIQEETAVSGPSPALLEAGEVALVGPAGELAAIAGVVPDAGTIVPRRVLAVNRSILA